jgi:ComF family protein
MRLGGLALLDLALPPRCPGCGAITGAADRFCAGCWQSLRFLGAPWCAGCNLPFDHDQGDDARCAACLAAPPRHAGVRAAVAYGEVARTLALRLKYGGRSAYATTAARLMRRHLPAGADLLVPVPLHRWRLWSRGYNQAALIAGALSGLSGVAADPRLLERHRPTPVLRGHSPAQRRRAVAGAFRIAPGREDRVADRAIALVDDVYTSGATADACADVLLRAGAASVMVLAWARVLGEAAD